MPEFPDIEAYRSALTATVVGQRLGKIRLLSPFLLRSVEPPVGKLEGNKVAAIERLGKRLVFALEHDYFMVLHLMIAGRLKWQEVGRSPPRRRGLAAFDFESGTLTLTEAGTKKRASLYLVQGRARLSKHDPGGIDVIRCSAEEFHTAITRENHTLKRSLTDPRLFSGIGNAYSDEILHAARLSPIMHSQKLTATESQRLLACCKQVLIDWRDRIIDQAGGGMPRKVTAFRNGMAVHGRYGRPCPVCGDPVQRIVYAENETNYCATCQTGGKLLADRALSRLLKNDWPRSLEELEETQPSD